MSVVGGATAAVPGANAGEAGRDATKDKKTPRGGAIFVSEGEANYLFRQAIAGMEYLHNNSVAHRDMKLDNVLLDDSIPPVLKISDFGFSKGDADVNTFTTIGTPCYMAPEVTSARGAAGYLPKAADVWSCGVLLFATLFGKFPFDSASSEAQQPNTVEVMNDIKAQQKALLARGEDAATGHFLGVDMSGLSPECRGMLKGIFELNPRKRLTIRQIKAHPWLQVPLSPAFTHALEDLHARQKAANKRSKEFFRVHGDWWGGQQMKLQMLLSAAVEPGAPGSPAIWVDLRRAAAPLDDGTVDDQLPRNLLSAV